MPAFPETVCDYLRQCIGNRCPDTLLVVSAGASIAHALADPFPKTALEHQTPECAGAHIPDEARFDLAVIIDALETLARPRAERLVGRLRDINAAAVLAVIDRKRSSETPGASPWRQADFIALGFTRCAGTRQLASGWDLYRYDVHDYKTTPSWLNARHWANPQRWGKQRW